MKLGAHSWNVFDNETLTPVDIYTLDAGEASVLLLTSRATLTLCPLSLPHNFSSDGKS